MRRPTSLDHSDFIKQSDSVRQDVLLVTVIVLTGLVEVVVVFALAAEPTLVLAGGMLVLVLVGVFCLLYSLRE
jgi:hypothetical protein